MKLEDLVQKFMEELGLTAPLKSSTPGGFSIPLEESVTVNLSPLSPFGFELRSEFVDCPKEDLESIFTELLHANLFTQGTKGACLGLNEQKNRLVLTQQITTDISYETFTHLIEDFINTIDFWREELTNKQ
jgi:hypothetical protein